MSAVQCRPVHLHTCTPSFRLAVKVTDMMYNSPVYLHSTSSTVWTRVHCSELVLELVQYWELILAGPVRDLRARALAVRYSTRTVRQSEMRRDEARWNRRNTRTKQVSRTRPSPAKPRATEASPNGSRGKAEATTTVSQGELCQGKARQCEATLAIEIQHVKGERW